VKPVEFRHDQICNYKVEVSIIEQHQGLGSVSRGLNRWEKQAQESWTIVTAYLITNRSPPAYRRIRRPQVPFSKGGHQAHP
jgi:hypothetical protein